MNDNNMYSHNKETAFDHLADIELYAPTQTRTKNGFLLHAEVRFGKDYAEGEGVRCVVELSRAILSIFLGNCRISLGSRYNDTDKSDLLENSGNDISIQNLRVKPLPGNSWEICEPETHDMLNGKYLGREALCSIEHEGHDLEIEAIIKVGISDLEFTANCSNEFLQELSPNKKKFVKLVAEKSLNGKAAPFILARSVLKCKVQAAKGF